MNKLERQCLQPRPFDVPAMKSFPSGAWDTHIHTIGSPGQYPLSPEHAYVPAAANISDYVEFMDKVGLRKAVLVQPSVYGTDNSALLDTLANFPDRFSGVAVVDPGISDAELSVMHTAGVRGVRVNLQYSGNLSIENAQKIASRTSGMGWHVQVLTALAALDAVESLVRTSEVVFDHFGFLDVVKGTRAAEFQQFLRLFEKGRCWVKLSAPYRLNTPHYAVADTLAPFVEELVNANPDRLLWGSDWPHTDIYEEEDMPDDHVLVRLLSDWVTSSEVQRKILVDNPERLYGAS